MVRLVSRGQTGFVSSIEWVATVFAYSEWSLEGGQLNRLLYLIRLVREIDPDWATPYEFGGMVLDDPKCPKCTEYAGELLAAAAERFPHWRYRVYYGMFLLNRKNDTAGAIRILEPLARSTDPNAPKYIRGLALAIQSDRQGVISAIRRMSEIAGASDAPKELGSFFRQQSVVLLQRDQGLVEWEVRAVSPLLDVVFESPDWDERTQALLLLKNILESKNRTDRLKALVIESATAPESESSRSR